MPNIAYRTYKNDIPKTFPIAGKATCRQPLTDQVADAIRDMIVQDELQPGERVRERQLAERLRVSRTPLREALKILAAEGLLELMPNRGAVVPALSQNEIRDMLQVLTALESLAGELAAERASDTEIAEIGALHHEMLDAYTRKDRLAYFKLNQRIHTALVGASRNGALIDNHRRLNAQLYRMRYRSNLYNTRWHSAIEEHEHILAALQARDAVLLAALMKSHLGNTWIKVRENDRAGATAAAGAEP